MLFRSKTAIQNELTNIAIKWLEIEFWNLYIKNSISISVYVHYSAPNANNLSYDTMLRNDNNTQQLVNSATYRLNLQLVEKRSRQSHL